MPPKAGVKRKVANGYKMPEKLNEGTILTALSKKQFRIGKSIGVGGFGEIYLCSDCVDKPVGDDAPFALKIEPHENGPLFVEMNFYIRAAASEAIEAFKKSRGLPSLGMPCYRGSGSHIVNGEKYRFLVMDRFGSDLQKIFQTGKNPFSDKLTFNLAIKIIDSLEYIHSQGYVHNDVKAQNLLLGFGKGKENDVYVVDFGLATKFNKTGGHCENKPDPKKAHDGTIEYTSRDAHIGIHARRSDLEILAYNLVHWMSGKLPWMNRLTSPEAVHKAKKDFFADIKGSLEECFDGKNYPDVLLTFLTYVEGLKFEAEPDYNKCRTLFQDALKKAKHPLDYKLDFGKANAAAASPTKKKASASPAKKRPAAPARKSASPVKRKAVSKKTVLKDSPKKSENGAPKPNGISRMVDSGTQTSPAFVKAAKSAARSKANPELDEFVAKAVGAAKKATAAAASPASKTPTRKAPARGPKPSTKKSPLGDTASVELNPTPAMAALLKMREEKENEKKNAKKRKKPAVTQNSEEDSPAKSKR